MSRFDYDPYAAYGAAPAVGLAKDPGRAVLFGVCAGIARYLGVSTLAVRLVALISLFLSFGVTVLGYLLLAVVLDKVPGDRFAFHRVRRSYRYRW